MRTSLNNIKAIDDHIFGLASPADALLFEAKLILNDNLRDELRQQQAAYEVIRQYGRKKLRAEIAAVQHILQTRPQHRGFMQRIANLFKNR